MKIKTKTSIFIAVSILIMLVSWIGYDIYAMVSGGTEGTISFTMYEWGYKYPIFTFACGFFPGVLVGHFFWQITVTKTSLKITEFVKGRKIND